MDDGPFTAMERIAQLERDLQEISEQLRDLRRIVLVDVLPRITKGANHGEGAR